MPVISALAAPAVFARGSAGASTSGSASVQSCHTSLCRIVGGGRGGRAAGNVLRAQAVQTKPDVAVMERSIVMERSVDLLDGGPPRARRVAERAIEAAQFADFEEMPIADEMKGQVSVMKVDTDEYPKLASRYNVKALPTLLLFREGRMVDRVEGVMAEVPLAKRVRYYVGRMDKKFGRQ